MAKSPKKPAAKPLAKAGRKLVRKVARKIMPKAAPSRDAAGLQPPPTSAPASAEVLDRLWAIVLARRTADPTVSHSARLLQRGTAKVAQKFGEEAVECLIEAVAGNRQALVGESADVLYHLLVMWVAAGVDPADVWAELQRREGISGIAEKASRPKPKVLMGTTKIP